MTDIKVDQRHMLPEALNKLPIQLIRFKQLNSECKQNLRPMQTSVKERQQQVIQAKVNMINCIKM